MKIACLAAGKQSCDIASTGGLSNSNLINYNVQCKNEPTN